MSTSRDNPQTPHAASFGEQQNRWRLGWWRYVEAPSRVRLGRG